LEIDWKYVAGLSLILGAVGLLASGKITYEQAYGLILLGLAVMGVNAVGKAAMGRAPK